MWLRPHELGRRCRGRRPLLLEAGRWIGADAAVSLAWLAAVASAMAPDAAGASRSRSVTPQRSPGGGGRRRRPSGEPPPLPRHLGVSGRVWITLAASLVAILGPVLPSRALSTDFDRWNAAVLLDLVSLRTGWLTTLMVGVNTVLAARWTIGVLRLGTMVALVGLRRWRHLGVLLGCVVVVELAASQLALLGPTRVAGAAHGDRPTGQRTGSLACYPRRRLNAGLAGGRLRRSGAVRIPSYFRTLW
jgi:uncharacterized membrane protein